MPLYGARRVMPLYPFSNIRRRRSALAATRKVARLQHEMERIMDMVKQARRNRKDLALEHDFFEAAYCYNAVVFDLALTATLFYRTREPDERHFLCRVMCLHLYEAGQLPNALTRSIRDVILARSAAPLILEAVSDHSRALRQFWDRNRLMLKEIRNNCIAHRERDFSEFQRAARSVNVIRTLNMVSEFFILMNPFSTIVNHVIRSAGSHLKDGHLPRS
jgi:hypothetical protein